jgi:hypothetical protein
MVFFENKTLRKVANETAAVIQVAKPLWLVAQAIALEISDTVMTGHIRLFYAKDKYQNSSNSSF